MIRFITLNAFIGIFTILMCFYAFLIVLFDRNGHLIHKYAAYPWAKVILFVCGVKLIVNGFEAIDKEKPYIFVMNHQGAFDIFALLAGLRVDFKFILKQELTRIPLLGYMMGRLKYISIDRSDIRKAIKSMDIAADKVRNGTSVLMFPEGTRSEDGKVKAFKKGGFQVALKSGCEILPIAISGSKDIVPKGSLRISRGTIRMNIGKPIPVGGYSKKNINDLIAKTRDTVISLMAA